MKQNKSTSKKAPAKFISTGTGNYVHSTAAIYGTQNVTFGGKCIVMNDVILRGDLSAISFGVHVYIGADTVIRPCPKQVGNIVGYFELKIGSRVVIEEDCIVLPESMGSNITIEKGSIIGKGCKLGSGCYIKADSVLPPNMVVAPYVIMSGNPAQLVGLMPKEEPTAKLMTEKCDQLYDDFEKMISAGAL